MYQIVTWDSDVGDIDMMTENNLIGFSDIFYEEFDKETDRAKVILSVALLDAALTTVIRTRLVAVGSSKNELLDERYAPISSFSARIDLAYSLGLISARFCHDLHLIRKIRNDFAHDIQGCNFENPSVRNRIVTLTRSSIVKKDKERRERYPNGHTGDFQAMVSWMLFYLEALAQETDSIAPKDEEFGYSSSDL